MTRAAPTAALDYGLGVASFYLFLQFFLVLSSSRTFPSDLSLISFFPLCSFFMVSAVLNGSVICQTALCYLEHICVPQAVNCWVLHRIVAELARISASEPNRDPFVSCGKSELRLLYSIKGSTAFKTIVAMGAH